MKSKKLDNLAAIRTKFGVPARRGHVVQVNGRPGIITGMSGDFVRVRLEGSDAGLPFHPHDIVYASTKSSAQSSSPSNPMQAQAAHDHPGHRVRSSAPP